MELKVSKSEASDINQRLNVFKRLLEDLQNAVTFTSGVDGAYATKVKAIESLTKEESGLKASTAKARSENTQAVEANQRSVDSMTKSYTKQMGGKQIELDNLTQKTREAETAHKNRMEAMEKEYAGRLATLQSEEAKEQAAIQRASDKREAYKREARAME